MRYGKLDSMNIQVVEMIYLLWFAIVIILLIKMAFE